MRKRTYFILKCDALVCYQEIRRPSNLDNFCRERFSWKFRFTRIECDE